MPTPLRPTARLAAGTAAGAAALLALAGCAADGADASSTAAASGATSARSSGYTDGTYTESGQYSTPGGVESITVKVVLKSGIVTAVDVSGTPTTPNAQHYQQAFASGISGAVVGKPLKDLKVGAVSGSSLTGAGFDAALAKIRDDAA